MALPPCSPDLADLDLFAAVVRTGSISRAAAAQGVTQPSATARLARLERRTGLQLLHRSSSGTVPTAAGVVLDEHARRVLEGVANLASALAAARGETRSSLHVTASYTVAEYVLPGWLATLGARDPGVMVHVEVANSVRVIDDVLHGRAELGFVEGPTVDLRLDAITVGEDDLVVVVAPGHPWARRGRPIDRDELAATRLVSREPGSGTRAALAHLLGAQRVAEPVAELGSTAAVVTAIAAGMGPGAVSRLALASALSQGQLLEVAVAGPPLRRELRAVRRRGTQPAGAVAALLAVAMAIPHGRGTGGRTGRH